MTDSQLELINIPDVVMNEILEYLDFPEILKLRKVCHYFKDFIDEVKSKSILKDINIIFYPKEIRFDLFSVQNERYNAEQLYVNRNIFVILDVLKLEHFSLVEVKMDRLRGKELLELREPNSGHWNNQ
ncbi:hypothetical protein L5515_009569 [Caenorhabditis briggsae]|uniref:F-box domain-containing protein n=1 Tax=Caenorhabditis briggsae TaxID=6238 RepID=A0AAE9F8J6_CAEBR|nr:hypothetical protein L5515_009569 [Caenorhabditis briggsae]